MTISKEQAESALQDLEHAGHRSATLYKYTKISPYLILWGCVWMAAYGLSDVWPSEAGLIWLIADGIGAALSICIARAHGPAVRKEHWRVGAIILTLLAFTTATFAILPPHSGKQMSAFVPLVIATAYILVGIWHGKRLVILGVLVGALTLLGFFLLHSHFNLWMALVGGGALILAGAWLKRV
ncbi:hypothetical protein [Duganella sp. S19_KUP01_CR8]|uniref:hypothetical protein n=1 Tax=Duganella sp. S19_KUP01_CR8 TaxID=3025502 RepID=UPI002FCDC0C1